MNPAPPTRWRPVLPPLVFAMVALAATRFITDRPEEAAAMARGIAGPTTWPTVMLWSIVVFALGWALQRAAQVLREREGPRLPAASNTAVANEPPVGAQVWLGIALVLAYGFSLPWLGFALATLLYIALWLLLGGVRSGWQIGLTSVIGTTLLLYLFVKLALMPLDRGVGVIGEFSVALYRVLRIY